MSDITFLTYLNKAIVEERIMNSVVLRRHYQVQGSYERHKLYIHGRSPKAWHNQQESVPSKHTAKRALMAVGMVIMRQHGSNFKRTNTAISEATGQNLPIDCNDNQGRNDSGYERMLTTNLLTWWKKTSGHFSAFDIRQRSNLQISHHPSC